MSSINVAPTTPTAASQILKVTPSLPAEGATAAKESPSAGSDQTQPATTGATSKTTTSSMNHANEGPQKNKENEEPAPTTETDGATGAPEDKTTTTQRANSPNKPLSTANSANVTAKRVDGGALKRKVDDIDASEIISAPRVARRARAKFVAQPSDRVTRGLKSKVQGANANEKVADAQKDATDAVAAAEDVNANETTDSAAMAPTPSKANDVVDNKSEPAAKTSEDKASPATNVPTQGTFRMIKPSAAWLAAGNPASGVMSRSQYATFAASKDVDAEAAAEASGSTAATKKVAKVAKKNTKAKKASKDKVGGGKGAKVAV